MNLTEKTNPRRRTRRKFLHSLGQRSQGTAARLGLRVAPGGAKAFVLDYADADGKRRRATLARVGELSLAEARDRARRELLALRDGEADPLARRQAAREAPTVAEGVARFFGETVPRRIADGRLTERTVRDYRRQADLTILPSLGDMKIRAVTRADIERAVEPRAPVQRNRTIALLSRLFNPVRGLGMARPRHQPRAAYREKRASNRATACCRRPNWRRWRRDWTPLKAGSPRRSPRSASPP